VGQMKCKWLSDDFTEVCTNVDCDYLADFCPCTEFPAVCRHSELVEVGDGKAQRLQEDG